MKTVIKAFKILDLFNRETPVITLSEAVSKTGFSKTTTHGLLKTLLSLNCLTKNHDNASYRLGPKLFEFGSLFIHQLSLPQIAMPYLKKIAQKTGDTAFLCVPDNNEALCLERVEGGNFVRAIILLKGGRLPLHTGTTPLSLLSGLDDEEIVKVIKAKGFKRYTDNTIQDMDQLMEKVQKVRRDGYAVSWEDLVIGIASVGAPIYDHHKKIVASISVAGLIQGFGQDRIEDIIDLVVSNAQSISHELGYSPD